MHRIGFLYRLKFLIYPHQEIAKRIYAKLRYYPKNPDLFRIAFTHRSAQVVLSDGSKINNERLEYLGDAILDAVIADYLFKKFPNEDEGFLTQMRSRIVKRDYLNMLSQNIGLDQLIISNTARSYGKKNIFGDAFEAFIGAIYLDRGYEYTLKFITQRIIPNYINLENILHEDTNFKSQLLEWSQKEKKHIDFYTDNDPKIPGRFISYIRIDQEIIGIGTGSSKKEAEQEASEKAIFRLNIH